LKQLQIAAIAVIITVVAIAAVYGTYSAFYAASPSPSPTTSPSVTPQVTSTPLPTAGTNETSSPTSQPTSAPTNNPTSSPTAAPTSTSTPVPTPTPAPTNVTFVDYVNHTVTLNLPVKRIVVLDDSLAGIVCALGAQDKIVARSDGVIYPATLTSLPSVGTSAYSFSMESVLSLNPDVVIANSMLTTDNKNKLTAAGIPYIVENAGIPSRVNTVVTEFGLILNNPAKAAQINNSTNYYTNLIAQRIQSLPASQRTTFYYEWGTSAWMTQTNGTSGNDIIVSCGGINIARNSTVAYPTLNAEFVAESNPDVIIQAISGSTAIADYTTAYDSMTSRIALQETNAIKTGRVHIMYLYLTYGVRYPVGDLYIAKWLYPTLFADINPDTIYANLVQQYFGIQLTGTYTYSGTTAASASLSSGTAAYSFSQLTNHATVSPYANGPQLEFKPLIVTADSSIVYNKNAGQLKSTE
jgi:iron complex transport system substrate-binding protein